MRLGIPVYEGVDLLDVAGPYEMFKWVNLSKGLESVILSEDGGPFTTLNNLRFHAHASFAAILTLNGLCVPGGHPTA
jgi:putative intracellular protease/amidase